MTACLSVFKCKSLLYLIVSYDDVSLLCWYRFAEADTDSRWASLDRYSRRPCPRRRPPVWSADDLDNDDRQLNYHQTDHDEDDGQRYQETVLSASHLTSVEDFDGRATPTGRFPISILASPLSPDTGLAADYVTFQTDAVAPASQRRLTGVTWSAWTPDGRDGVSGLSAAARASSEGDVLAAGVQAARGRSSRLLSSASTLFGRFVAQTHRRQRLTTVSSAAVDWRRRKLQLPASSHGFYHDDDDCGRLDGGTRTAAASDEKPCDTASREVGPLPPTSLSGSADWSGGGGSRQRSHRRLTNTPSAPLSTAERPAADHTTTSSNHDVQRQWTRVGSRHRRPAVQRYPSVERLDLPRRQSTAALTVGDRSPFSADRKRAERFRRQYIDVKLQPLQRQPQPTQTTTKSMPTGVNMCGRTTAHRDDVVLPSPQLLREPATADVTLT